MSGNVIGYIDNNMLMLQIDILCDPNTSARQVRKIIRKGVPTQYNISNSDIRNVRMRAMKLYLQKTAPNNDDISKVYNCIPLHQDESFLPEDAELCNEKIELLIKEFMNATNGCQLKAITFLKR